jgi:hypothetical protein
MRAGAQFLPFRLVRIKHDLSRPVAFAEESFKRAFHDHGS